MTDRIICHPSLAQCRNNLIINIGLSSMHWHTCFIGMKQVCHNFGTTVSKAWKSESLHLASRTETKWETIQQITQPALDISYFCTKCKNMDIKTIGINNESPLFYVTLALFFYRLSPIVYCYLLIYKILRCTGDSDRCF